KKATLGYNAYIDEKRENKLQPGEAMILHELAEIPENMKAEEFLWTVQLKTNNQGSRAVNVYIFFKNEDVKIY
nr:hypothetical protein [Bacteroidota bacterium]